jgi:hypothetical protein
MVPLRKSIPQNHDLKTVGEHGAMPLTLLPPL